MSARDRLHGPSEGGRCYNAREPEAQPAPRAPATTDLGESMSHEEGSTVERWAPWPTDPRYEVSDQGRVRSWRPWRGKSLPHTLKQHLWRRSGGGHVYPTVAVACKMRRVSRMVLEAFVGPAPTEDHEAAHWSGDPSNNRLVNLRWATHAENMADEVRLGRSHAGERCPVAKLNWDQVRDIRRRRELGESARAIAESFGLCPSHVRSIARGKRWAGEGSP